MLMPAALGLMVVYVVSFLLVMGGGEWIFIWMGLEINMISFISLVSNKFSSVSMEVMFKYFFIQSLSSVVFLGSVYWDMSYSISMCVLMMKLGLGPFYFWVPSVMSGLSWAACYVLVTFQKVLPLYLLTMFNHWAMWWFSFFSLFVGMMGAMNSSSLSKLMAFSSVNQGGWMIVSMLISQNLLLLYLLVYMMLMLPFFMFLNESKMEYLVDISSNGGKFKFFLYLFNIGGLPPMLGFFLKLMVLFYAMKYDLLMAFFLVLSSVYMLYIYMRMLFDSLLSSGYLLSHGFYSIGSVAESFFLFLNLLGVTIMGLFVYCCDLW
uniref:NADH-ubiquinone oxidoreductase chain 2 n=1 Tax=Hypochilus thorelli TaxID=139869 RepID=B2CKT1_HYPTH|nr:NADH dehydrogenase subunit 2 [Hypochilus thorelli]ACA62643.1 NADH dehydrogenase subunit 2 [Hypochilus thorelli]